MMMVSWGEDFADDGARQTDTNRAVASQAAVMLVGRLVQMHALRIVALAVAAV